MVRRIIYRRPVLCDEGTRWAMPAWSSWLPGRGLRPRLPSQPVRFWRNRPHKTSCFGRPRSGFLPDRS